MMNRIFPTASVRGAKCLNIKEEDLIVSKSTPGAFEDFEFDLSTYH